MKRFLSNSVLALILLFLVFGSVSAQHCGVNGGYATNYNYHNGYAVQQNYGHAVQYNIIELPLYSAGYSAGGDPYAVLELASAVKELAGSVKSFNLVNTSKSEQDVTKSGVDVNVGNQFTQLLTNDCAACHTGSRAKGGFQLFSENNQLLLSCEAMLKIVDRAYVKGDMPPRHEYSEEEKNVIIKGVSFYLENQK